jgi:ABC-type nitrate/sulfonate/bicarbonate transport system substrate-binding protein
MRGRSGILVGILGLIVVSAAPGSVAAGQTPYQAVAAVGNNMNHVPSFVGVEKGIFLKHGVDLKLKVLSTGQEMSKAVQAGEAQFLGAAFSNFPVAVERGLKAKGFVGLMGDRAGKYSDEPIAIVTRKGTGITKIEDLAGKKVGTPVGGTGHEYLGVALKKAGIAADKVTVVNIPPGNSVSALAGGQVDAISVWEPYGSLMMEKVPEAVLVQRGGGLLGYYINMSALADVLDKQSDMVFRYAVALTEASQYTRQHLDEAAEITTRWVPGLDYGVAKKAIRNMRFDPRITKPTIESWEENVRILVEQKKMRQPLPWEQGIELKFIERVQKEYPQLFSDLPAVR